MKVRLIRIGNSKGVRLPKPLIDAVGLGEDVELEVRDGAILIAPVEGAPRDGWSEAASRPAGARREQNAGSSDEYSVR
ncbi:MAG: AbrB/MazE/SpoVT family DNA-binding domain-containing protein [Candidatus Latescibacteria bacterium]|jgi:antitoxin MazE|nr:AbrB/MazE/SpoVT family DNA-binding domain-containing protein [Candidatus Latescibacterota bacterium]MDP7449304.1 AbrB/MazE/SpoVT family DNA-binding domain-containing protein [Candidatus Latescibacterota bacterium]HJP32946.1 AbrB/MazE/SpoVT family DNA-binding domain-containing protein [Candidatus Latescibacterota bacterium]